MKITTLLFEKIGLFKRESGLNRENPRWQDMIPLAPIELELRRRELESLFEKEGPVSLLKELYEEDDVVRIVGRLE